MERGEQLMTEMAWVRRLARALVRDPAAAEDVAQDAWIVAAEGAPPEGDRPLRPWLARVVKNLAHTRRRGAQRREAREHAAETTRAVPTPAELVERVELQRVVAGEVLALAEPYRSTILLHFVEGYSSAEIARRLGIPDGTVRRRLKVALDQLRAALHAREDQPKKGWLAALAPLAIPSPSVTVGVLAMKKLAIAVALLILLVVFGVVVFARRDHAPTGKGTPSVVANGAPAALTSKTRTGFPAWLAQAGAPDRQIAGHVLAGGAPVAGAIVRLGLAEDGTAGDGSGAAPQFLAEVRSGADGAFDFGMQPAAVFAVSASSAAHSPVAVTVHAADPTAHPERLRLELGDCRSKLFGSVTDASGGPVVRARLSVAALSGGETDERGQYSLCLPPDAPILRIDADGYGSLAERISSVNELMTLTGDLRRDFVLVPEAVLAGKVVDSGGRPVAGARVVARPALDEARRRVATGWADSDAAGAFRIAGLAPAQYDLAATADGYASALPVPAVARPASTSAELRLVLGSVARVKGQVVLDGAPVAGAAVIATTASGQASHKAVSQQDGTFVLDGVPMGAVAFAAAPYDVRSPKIVTIDRAQLDRVKLEVAASARIHGHVTCNGKPVPGAHVTTGAMSYTTLADDTGAYTLTGLATGAVVVDAWDAREKAFAPAKRVTLAPGDVQEVDLELEGSGEILGVVVDEGGQPVPGVYVMYVLGSGANDECEAMTDAEGKFDCPMLIGGDYVAHVAPSSRTREGFAPASGDRFPVVHVKPHEVVTGARLAIRNERLSIHGVVVGDGGAPIADVHVEAIGHVRGRTEGPSAMADLGGAFEIQDLPRGTYTVHAHAADGGDGVVAGVVAGGDPVTITLTRPGTIDGTLAGFARPPEIIATQTSGDPGAQARAIVDGNAFSLTGLRPGRYTVEARAGADADGQTVEVRSGETAHVALHSHGTGRVEGTVLEYGTTTPVVGMRCDAMLAISEQMTGKPSEALTPAYTDASGHFALTAPLGRVRVVCFGTDGPGGADVDITAAAVPQLALYSVHPTFSSNPAVPDFKLQPATLPITIARVDPAGRAAAAGIQAGDHLVTIDGGKLDGMLPLSVWFLLLNHASGSTTTLGIERGGAVRQVTLQLGAQ